jgi:hypothetical protein
MLEVGEEIGAAGEEARAAGALGEQGEDAV